MKKCNMLKKGLLIAFIASSITAVPVSAAPSESFIPQTSGSLDVLNINENVVESEVMTFDEMAAHMAENENISLTEAEKILLGNRNQNSISSSEVSPLAATYRTYTTTLTVATFYKPTLNFYCETSEWGNYRGIVKVLNTTMNRQYLGTSKHFGGTIFVHLESANKIHWIVEGDFYDNGTTTYTLGAEFPLKAGFAGNVNFSISHSENHYKYFYDTGDYMLYRE
ncbi:hypothetical protein [Paenibacillus aquistagni]|uniref:Toxin ETX/toxin MTX2 n=1 Tax=Paenibacillus aquistagni TaxID=1852522 RepID=A0A1X7KRB4_9BACL|nr:hypothetical protein [Paenibacillus aquistagni]SMG44088.1 hypothetical protein SAMN06295960_2618 [Paenibacillus aquistagni]